MPVHRDAAMDLYRRQGYRFSGNSAATKVCLWTKKSLLGRGVCYKERWYPPVKSHRCLQMTPSIFSCENRCLFCWRTFPASGNSGGGDPKEETAPPRMLDELTEARRKLLMGFGGNADVDQNRLKEALIPSNVAISLAGEPTEYPMMGELLEECHKRNLVTFLVTNGSRPDKLSSLKVEPTQLYLSLCAPDEETFGRVYNPTASGGWPRLMESLAILNSFSCRKVVRLTLVKGLNMKDAEKYARLIRKANPDFVEVKGYMHIGESTGRLPREAMPAHSEVLEFAGKIASETGYEIKADAEESRVVLLSRR